MTAFRSSGNLAADRRFLWAEAARHDGDFAGAAELFAQAVEIAPGWAAGWHAYGDALERSGQMDASQTAFRHCLVLDPGDELGAALHLARLDGHAAAMPRAFVAGLFDGYAASFDTHLVGALAYRGPAVLIDALTTVAAPSHADGRFGEVLDLGCGTGLFAEALNGRAAAIDGVDLSAGMLAVARKKQLYRALAEGDVVEYLLRLSPATRYHLIVAADVLVYIGDLAPLFSATRQALAPDGLFAFTVQSHSGEGYVLGPDMRFHHSAAYIRSLADASGFACRLLAPAVTRRDAGADVAGLVVVLAS